MCLALLALDAHPLYAVAIAANRDEFHARPAAPAAWWPQGLLAGRDLAAGGTWLGVTRDGRFAFITNIRDPARHDPTAPSRGALVPEILADEAHPRAVLARVRASALRHNGFNLVAGSTDGFARTSNRAEGVRELGRGVHGVSNGIADAHWPKVVRTRAALTAWCERGDASVEPLFVALADRALAPDRDLPATGVSLEWERQLSAPFIVGERYGTRCTTVLALGRDGNATFVERSFGPDGRQSGEVTERFTLARQRSARSMTM